MLIVTDIEASSSLSAGVTKILKSEEADDVVVLMSDVIRFLFLKKCRDKFICEGCFR